MRRTVSDRKTSPGWNCSPTPPKMVAIRSHFAPDMIEGVEVGEQRILADIIGDPDQRRLVNEGADVVEDQLADGGVRLGGEDDAEKPAERGTDPVDLSHVETRDQAGHVGGVGLADRVRSSAKP